MLEVDVPESFVASEDLVLGFGDVLGNSQSQGLLGQHLAPAATMTMLPLLLYDMWCGSSSDSSGSNGRSHYGSSFRLPAVQTSCSVCSLQMRSRRP